MKKLLGISLVAVLAVSPLMASAADVAPSTTIGANSTEAGLASDATGVITAGKGAYYAGKTITDKDKTSAASAAYVKGAYNDAISAVNKVSADATTALAGKQGTLTEAQLAAANSGITADKVSTYDGYATGKQDTLSATNKLDTAYVATGDNAQFVTATEKSTWSGKQDALSADQLAATNSGITAAKVTAYDGYAEGKQDTLSATNQLNTAYVATNDNAQFVTATEKSTWSGKQDALSADQLAATNSGITQAKREGYDAVVTASANYATRTGVSATVNAATGSVALTGSNALSVTGSASGSIDIMENWGDGDAQVKSIALKGGSISGSATTASGSISGIDVAVTDYTPGV